MPDTQLQAAQLFQQGQAFRMAGDYDNAIAMFQRVIDEDPNHVGAHMELGLAYCFTGLFDESIRELELAVGLDNTNPEVKLHLAKTYTMLGMFEEGAVMFQEVMRLSVAGDKFYLEAEKQLGYFKSMM